QIPDGAVQKRIATDYPALALKPADLLLQFPSRHIIDLVAQGKQPYPSDPIEAGLYETMVYKWNVERDQRNAAGLAVPPPVLTDEQVAQKKKEDQATAARIAGALFALPKQNRMLALMKVPVANRIAFVNNVDGDQKRLLLADFTPHEREIVTALAANIDTSGVAVPEMQQARLIRDILSERQLQEVMTDFWFNHFNIYIYKDQDKIYTPAYERDVIRPHALGKFRDLLLATAQSPAMMVYLDNYTSIGSDSIANGGNNPNGKRGARGLNENYAREVMELHTVGVNGGYTQADVTQLARILTGWGVDHQELGGGFLFNPKAHEPGNKQWLGQTVKEDGMNEGLGALSTLAASPKTAHFISTLIAQRFVADTPPLALVDRMVKTYMSTDGDISAVLRTMVQSPEFNSHRYFLNKVKTPVEFVASTFRSTATDPTNPASLVYTIQRMGMPLYAALPPTGYYITAEQWMNTSALVDRLNFAVSLTRNGVGGIKFDAPRLLALQLMSEPTPADIKQGRVLTTATPVGSEIHRSGADIVLGVLESALIAGGVSDRTQQFMHQQAEQQAATNSTDRLNQLTALVLGSPEFQMR
ncbi:MAG: DUF1800 domain-containing protein, partial [Acidobacteriaceae bacterium]|nr:DUF1800 domain-containing protein [Acidobacteriaceae bacterium]